MMPVQISDYSTYNVPPYLLEQFRGSDIQKFISLFDRQFNDIEAAAFSFINGMSLDSAYGDTLDVWGLRLGLTRNGREDVSYRTLLKVQTFINNASGNAETIITAMRALFNVSIVHYTLDSPAKVHIDEAGAMVLLVYDPWVTDAGEYLRTDTNDQLVIAEVDTAEQVVLQEILPAGVLLEITFTG